MRLISSRGWAVIAMMALTTALTACGTRLPAEEIAAGANGTLTTGGVGTVSTDGASGLVEGGDGPASAVDGEGAAVSQDAASQGPAGGPADAGAGATTSAGSSAGEASSSGGPAAAGSAGGSKEPLRIGNVSTVSGPSSSAQSPAVVGLRVWVKYVNARGGIDGRPVELAVGDDGADPGKHAVQVRQLVEEKKVIAFVGNMASQSNHGGREYVNERKIPIIGGDSSTRLWYEDPMYFPTSGNIAYQGEYVLDVAKRYATQAGKDLGILVCQEASICTEYADQVAAGAGKYGYTVRYNGRASFAQPDYTAACLSARNNGVGLFAMQFDAASFKRIARSCESQGYRPAYVLNSSVDSSFEANPIWEGAVLNSPSVPFQGASGPGIDEFKNAMKQYAPQSQITGVTLHGWTAGQLFAKAVQGVQGTPTNQHVLEGLWKVKGETLGDMTVPLTFRKGAPAQDSKCYFPMVIKGQKLTAPLNTTSICL